MQCLKTGENRWIFAAPTVSGHIEQSSINKQHAAAITASKVRPFVIYDARHTCLTRWAKTMDPFTLKKLAGHESLATTMRYIHLNESESEQRLNEARQKHLEETARLNSPKDEAGHTSWHTGCDSSLVEPLESEPSEANKTIFWRARRGSNSRPNDSKSFALSN